MKQSLCVPCQASSVSSEVATSGDMIRVPRGPFASKSVAEHLIRGGIAATAIYLTIAHGDEFGALGLGLVAVGLVALRGCPMCWAVGLFDTVSSRVK